MKQIKTIFLLVLVSAVLFSCSNARYGHMKKVKKDEKATVQKHERKSKSVQLTEEVAVAEAIEEAALVNETVVVETPVAETAPVVASTVTTKANNSTVTASAPVAKNSIEVAAKNDVKETKQAVTEVAKKKKGGKKKSQLIALILCGVVGYLGIHRFYLGYTWQGIVQLLTGGLCGIWTLIDFIRIITGDLKPKNGDYDETL